MTGWGALIIAMKRSKFTESQIGLPGSKREAGEAVD
jgi:hypothetical protein